jgi:membrane fusion protein, multidrug efflux system
MTADMRNVTVKRTVGNESVISSGLKPGERVVTDGQLRLTKGARVEMKSAAAASQTQSQGLPAGKPLGSEPSPPAGASKSAAQESSR